MFNDRAGRIVKQEYVGKLYVSTVFLGLDHSWVIDGPPILWETMVFQENPEKEYLRRVTYWFVRWMPRWMQEWVPWRYRLSHSKKVEVDGYTERCSGNREQAEAMHSRVVAMLKARL